MSNLGETSVVVKLDSAPFKAGLESIKKASQGLGASLLGILGPIGATLAGAFSVGKMVSGFIEGEEAATNLASALKTNGQEVDKNVEKFKKLAAEIQAATTVGDEDTFALLTKGLNLGVPTAELDNYTKSAIGLGKALGIDAATAMEQLAKEGQGVKSTLDRQIPALKGVEDQAERMRIISELAGKGFQQEEASAQTLGGQLKQLWNAIGDLAESLGALLAPAISAAVSMLKGLTAWLQGNVDDTSGLAAAWAKVSAYIMPAVKIIGGAAGAFVAFKAAAMGASAAMTVMRGVVVAAQATFAALRAGLVAIQTALIAIRSGALLASAGMAIMSGVSTVIAVLTSPLTLIAAALVGIGAAAVVAMGGFSGVASAAKSAASGIMGIFGPIAQTALNAFNEVKRIGIQAFGGIKDAISSGNLALAGQIAITALKAVVLSGFASLTELVGGVWGDMLGTLGQQIMGGDFSGAWNTAVLTMGAVWDSFCSGIVNAFVSAAQAIMSLWAKTTSAISDQILESASKGGWGKYLLPVDMEAEQVRAEQNKAGQVKAKQSNLAQAKAALAKAESSDTGTAALKEGGVENTKEELAALVENLEKDLRNLNALPINVAEDAKEIARNQLQGTADAINQKLQSVADSQAAKAEESKAKLGEATKGGSSKTRGIADDLQKELDKLTKEAADGAKKDQESIKPDQLNIISPPKTKEEKAKAEKAESSDAGKFQSLGEGFKQANSAALKTADKQLSEQQKTNKLLEDIKNKNGKAEEKKEEKTPEKEAVKTPSIEDIKKQLQKNLENSEKEKQAKTPSVEDIKKQLQQNLENSEKEKQAKTPSVEDIKKQLQQNLENKEKEKQLSPAEAAKKALQQNLENQTPTVEAPKVEPAVEVEAPQAEPAKPKSFAERLKEGMAAKRKNYLDEMARRRKQFREEHPGIAALYDKEEPEAEAPEVTTNVEAPKFQDGPSMPEPMKSPTLLEDAKRQLQKNLESKTPTIAKPEVDTPEKGRGNEADRHLRKLVEEARKAREDRKKTNELLEKQESGLA